MRAEKDDDATKPTSRDGKAVGLVTQGFHGTDRIAFVVAVKTSVEKFNFVVDCIERIVRVLALTDCGYIRVCIKSATTQARIIR
jgi:hypothetical protein